MKHIIWGLLALGMMATSQVSADEMRTFAQWGIALEHPGTKSASDIKWGEAGISGERGKLAYTVGAGYWSDSTRYKTVKASKSQYPLAAYGKMTGASNMARSSPFVECLVGVEPKGEHLYVSYKLGPAWIYHPDALLGSYLQLAHELGLGMYDARGVRVGLVYKHFSNAGLIKPNVGRDFLGLRIEW